MNKRRLTYLCFIFPLLITGCLSGLWLAAPLAAAAPQAIISVDSMMQERPLVTNGNCTLAEAILSAETDTAVDGCTAGSGVDIIFLPAGTFDLPAPVFQCPTGALVCAFPPITTEIAIRGAGAKVTRIIRNPSGPHFRHFWLENSATLTLQNLTLANGYLDTALPSYIGGSVRIGSDATLNLQDVRFENNRAELSGGALAAIDLSGQINIIDSHFEGNSAAEDGGAVYRGDLTIENSHFISNSAERGGAIYDPTTLTASDSSFQDNSATNIGGAILACRDIALDSLSFQRNQALSGGGIFTGIYPEDTCNGQPASTTSIANSTFISNTASAGGGLWINQARAHFTNTHMIENYGSGTSQTQGMAFYAVESTITLDHALLKGNVARDGGAISVYRGTLQIAHSALISNVVSSNHAATGAGSAIRISGGSGSVELQNSTVSGNQSTGRGTLSANFGGGTFILRHTTVTNNYAGSLTGGLWDDSATGHQHIIENSILAGNSNLGNNRDFYFTGGSELNSEGYALIGQLGIGSFVAGSGDISGTVTAPAASGVHELHFLNGDWVHLPEAGGAAMDVIAAGVNGCGSAYESDQRDEERPVDYTGFNGCDIGAVERVSAEIHTDHVALSETQSFGGLQVTLTDKGLYSSSLGTITVNRSNQQPSNTDEDTPLPIQVTLSQPASIDRRTHDVNFDLTICYTDWELNQAQDVSEAGIGFLQASGLGWTFVEPTLRDSAANCIHLDGVDALGTWGIGFTEVPTAVAVRNQQAMEGNQLWMMVAMAVLAVLSFACHRANSDRRPLSGRRAHLD